jgi:ATP-dependent DNA helicase RecG
LSDQSGGRSSLRLLSVLDHADLIAMAKTIASEAIERDPDRRTPGFVDAVTATELLSAGDWLELS